MNGSSFERASNEGFLLSTEGVIQSASKRMFTLYCNHLSIIFTYTWSNAI
jgi:hypothetical protein